MTAVWGIVNVTPDSFSDGGRYAEADAAIAHGRLLRAQGADVLDIGGESTRPGAQRVPTDVERARVVPVIAALAGDGARVSIDTMNASTALAAVDAGARWVNDVSGGQADPEMLDAVAATDAGIVLGHWRGPSADMYAGASYGDVATEVALELTARVEAAARAGIAPHRIALDPGIGFAKTAAQNWMLLQGLGRIVDLGLPVLVGTSRKRFLAAALAAATNTDGAAGDVVDVDEVRRDLATAVTSALAAVAGAWAVRVHDVPSTVDALSVARAWHAGDQERADHD